MLVDVLFMVTKRFISSRGYEQYQAAEKFFKIRKAESKEYFKKWTFF
jgi:hypothetical protein